MRALTALAAPLATKSDMLKALVEDEGKVKLLKEYMHNSPRHKPLSTQVLLVKIGKEIQMHGPGQNARKQAWWT